jgi:hypothetical protein
METRDWLTLIALVFGPVAAVVISLLMEASRRTRENRLRVVRMLLSWRRLPAHPDYVTAINLVSVEFNDKPAVMEAWRRFLGLVNQRVPDTQEAQAQHEKLMEVAKARLIFEAMKAAGLKASEGDIQVESYVSQGLMDRDAIYLQSLQAMPEIAATLARQAELTQQLLNLAHAGRGAPPPSPPAHR